MSTNHPAVEKLRQMGNLSEWLLHDMEWRRFGSDFDFHFNNVFDESGNVRGDALEDPHLLVVCLAGVQSLIIENHLSQGILDAPERLDWGFSEIAGVRLEDLGEGEAGRIKFSVLWETRRRIEVVAASVAIAETQA
jgi:hypothetical protein